MITTILSMDIILIASFVGAGVMLNLTPGADVTFTVATSLGSGWRNGVAAAFGIALGSLVHISLAAFGVAAALAAWPLGFDLIRWCGAAYLMFLAYQNWRDAGSADFGHAQHSAPKAIVRGFLTNVLNPKVALFMLALLPQFADPAIGPVSLQMLALGGLFAVTGFFIISAYAIAAGAFGSVLRQRMSGLRKLTSIIFAGLAVRLVFD